jgi:hypothetical protein
MEPAQRFEFFLVKVATCLMRVPQYAPLAACFDEPQHVSPGVSICF